MLVACSPFGPVVTSKVTRCASLRDLKPSVLNRRVMDKDVRATFPLDEPEPLRVIEPLGRCLLSGGYSFVVLKWAYARECGNFKRQLRRSASTANAGKRTN